MFQFAAIDEKLTSVVLWICQTETAPAEQATDISRLFATVLLLVLNFWKLNVYIQTTEEDISDIAYSITENNPEAPLLHLRMSCILFYFELFPPNLILNFLD